MKVSLAQAWEAKGLAGMLLRASIVTRLSNRFYKENPAASHNIGWAFVYATLAGLAGISFVWFMTEMAPGLKATDFMYTSSLWIILVVGVLAFAYVVVLGVSVYMTLVSVAGSAKVGYVNRYIAQHRDEEIEL